MPRHMLAISLRLAAVPLGLAMLVASPIPAQAQFADSYTFLKAVRDRDGNKATELLRDETSRVINTRDKATGETALAIVVQRRDTTWMRFLIGKGGDPSIGDSRGITPLMHAALLGFTEGAEELIKAGAAVDQDNRRGETALILAVQRKDAGMVRLLVKQGANPDKSDHSAGMSARDYARRDDRSGQMLALLDAKADKALPLNGEIFGPK